MDATSVVMRTRIGKAEVHYEVFVERGEASELVWTKTVSFGGTNARSAGGAAFRMAAREQEAIAAKYRATVNDSAGGPRLKRCSRCSNLPKEKLWSCRTCGARCCAHLCALKEGAIATCGTCRLREAPIHRPGEPVLGRRTAYHGNEHPYLRDHEVVIVAVLKDALRAEECQLLKTEEDIQAAGGVGPDDRIEVAPILSEEGRPSFVTSDPRAMDLACFQHLARHGAGGESSSSNQKKGK